MPLLLLLSHETQTPHTTTLHIHTPHFGLAKIAKVLERAGRELREREDDQSKRENQVCRGYLDSREGLLAGSGISFWEDQWNQLLG